MRPSPLFPRARRFPWPSPSIIARSLSTPTTLAPKEKPYYISTPIFYVNAVPHIGHLYTSVVTDVLARYTRLRDPSRPVFFNTGTDEHGLKIQLAAEKAGRVPKEFCDDISENFKRLAEASSLSHTRFMRTTDSDHLATAQHFWRELEKRGLIYKAEYGGWYSISDECFYSDSQTTTRTITSFQSTEMEDVRVATETGSVVEWAEEINYKFRLSQFRESLIQWLETNSESVQPPSRHAALLREIKGDPEFMRDLSISRPRSRLSWGIPVPSAEEEHTMYVWLEALVNYLTAVGYPWKDSVELKKYWPTNVHVVGKDILKFHAVIFPSLLMALDLPLPRTILAHGHWTMDRQKMSKSIGNVVDPFEVMGRYGTDAVRYYMCKVGGGFSSDNDWSEEQLQNTYKRDLRGIMGNALSRFTAPKLRDAVRASSVLATAADKPQLLSSSSPARGANDGQQESIASLIEQVKHVPAEDRLLRDMLSSVAAKYEAHMDQHEIGKALEVVADCLGELARHTQELAWWKTPPFQRPDPYVSRRSYYYMHETLRITSILLQPYMPTKACEVLDVLGIPAEERRWEDAKALKSGEDIVRKIVLEERVGGNDPDAAYTKLWPPYEGEEAGKSIRSAEVKQKGGKRAEKKKGKAVKVQAGEVVDVSAGNGNTTA